MTDKQKIKICKYYKSTKKCTFEGNCAEQSVFDKTLCHSKLYYSMDLEEKLQAKEQECEKWKNKLAKSFADERRKEIEINQLQQALRDIKEIAQAITNGTHFTNNVEEHLKEMANKILEKINEVDIEIQRKYIQNLSFRI